MHFLRKRLLCCYIWSHVVYVHSCRVRRLFIQRPSHLCSKHLLDRWRELLHRLSEWLDQRAGFNKRELVHTTPIAVAVAVAVAVSVAGAFLVALAVAVAVAVALAVAVAVALPSPARGCIAERRSRLDRRPPLDHARCRLHRQLRHYGRRRRQCGLHKRR